MTLVATAGLLMSTSCHRKDAAESGATEMSVAVAYPTVDSITLTASFPGNLSADRAVALMARVNGVVRQVLAQSGTTVRKGQVLYIIEDTKYRDAVQQAKASLATAEADFAYYSARHAAMQKAYKAEAVSEMELLEAQNNMEQSKAQIENAKASLQSAQLMLSYCTITAPFDGKLGLQTFDIDDYISGEGSPVKLNVLYNDDRLNALISIDEPTYLKMMSNMERNKFGLDSVEITFADKLPHRYYSKLNFMAPQVNATTGTVTLRFNLPNPYGELKSGMYMNVHVPVNVEPRALLINDDAIGTDQLGKYVYTINDSNRVEYTHIEVGDVYRDTLRVVTEGLTPASRYVAKALLKVKEGMKVKPEAVNRPNTQE